MSREMHFTGTSAAGVCLASERASAVSQCSVEHLFLFPRDPGLFLCTDCWPGGRERGQGVRVEGRRKLLPQPLGLLPFSV